MSPGASRSARAESGFSLIEVLIVLVLIGLATVMAVPRIDLDFYRIDAGMHAVGSQLLTAQRLAVKRQHNVVVAFDTAAHRIRIHQDADNDGVIDAGEIEVFTALADGIVFGSSGAPAQALLGSSSGAVSFAGRQNGMPAVTFRRSGSASEEGGFVLTSKRAAAAGTRPQNTRGVRVERSTGRITWYRYSGSWKRES